MAKNDPLADSQKRVAAETAEQLARTENARPTPSQEENDRAKLGVDSLSELDNKDDDGGEEEKSSSASGSSSYQTRASTAKKS